MEYFSSQQFGRILILRLDPGDYVLESVTELIKKERIQDTVVISAIGTLDECQLHMVTTTDYPVVEYFRNWRNTPLELASTDGLIADGKPHLHAVVSDKEKAYAGHLEMGCRVLYLAEIIVAELKSSSLTRVYNDKNILKLTRKSAEEPQSKRQMTA